MPWIIARREKAGQISWVKLQGNSDQWAIVLVEQAPRSRFIELVPPGAQPESLQAGAEPPAYVGHFPGSTLKTSRIWADRTMEILVPGAKESNWLGRPLFQAEYTGPGDLSPFEFNEAYADALSKAGWTILKNTGGGSSGSAVLWARFSNATRDLWLSLGATNFGYEVLLADAGAQAEVRRLKEELDKNGHVALYGIYFDSDSSTLKPESEATLQQILKLLTANPALKLGIEGHTDNTGARPHNQTLSEARAASVKRWLVEHNISADRLTAAGFADTRPVAENGSPAGRAKNRRVELVSGATTPAPPTMQPDEQPRAEVEAGIISGARLEEGPPPSDYSDRAPPSSVAAPHRFGARSAAR
jgi:OOP family OmpA-OmpF porin